ncbi:arsenic transporter [Fictibacillus barbaricus]|uniref:Arsenical pump membrane protein n=1 Tax=Fictibacillus barbaricus TaxID=182136 RepID=A0ABU1U0G1_9BACL|nr:arsenic transporter [Fictibacillus barbaricus]MDR7072959.1 arsenical pump membrane protein [Fictibacillus barbaricus]
MHDLQILLTITIFALTIFFIVWNPWRLNETIPTSIGAFLLISLGIVQVSDLFNIFHMVSGASITILSTIVMSIVLESIGFFNWTAYNLVKRAKNSGVKLFLYINLLCYLMTLFFNNDGSILITTPIIIKTLNMLRLKPHQKIAFLLPGAITATASSAPIAISNIANLIALKIVGLDINSYVTLMFVPAMIGIIVIVALLFLHFKKAIPKKLPPAYFTEVNYQKSSRVIPHPLSVQKRVKVDWWMFKVCISIVIVTRLTFFILTPFGIPMEWVAIVGAILLILVRWYRKKVGFLDVIKKTPWHILLFAFSMYVLIFGLQRIGLTSLIVTYITELIHLGNMAAIVTMGSLLTVMSNIFNNLPAIMVGTLTLTEMNLDPHLLQVSYLATILGSDIGALITPIGTLATMLWIYILRENGIPISWKTYFKATIFVIPIGLIISLISLYFWTQWIFQS